MLKRDTVPVKQEVKTAVVVDNHKDMDNVKKDFKTIMERMDGVIAQNMFVQELHGEIKNMNTRLATHEQGIAGVANLQHTIEEHSQRIIQLETHLSQPDYAHQGNIVIMDEQHTDRPGFTTTEPDMVTLGINVSTTAPLEEGSIVIIQSISTGRFLYFSIPSKKTLPLPHFVWKELTEEDAGKTSRAQFQVENVDGNTLSLRSLSEGDLLSMTRDYDVYEYGYTATTSEDTDASTRLTIMYEEQGIHLIGPKKHHLTSITMDIYGQSLNVLATHSILPDDNGLLLLRSIRSNGH